MTRVQKTFHLQRVLDEETMSRIADAQAVYGIEWIRVAPSRQDLLVEYDASRTNAPGVESILQRAGIPVAAVLNG